MKKVYKKVCKRCGKELFSLSKSQCEYNFLIHDFSCKKKDVSGYELVDDEGAENGS